MANAREELISKIENARERLNRSIDTEDEYKVIYQCSVELDQLLNQYVVAGY
ncbi:MULTISPECIES: aspartyl-phosphate phosphatase Spo0E family protein [Clostridia]|uniref:aspartyl-phosphate phosphatase Spo0E family protein n=1 Tax=Clostridia TaxID=186801 RepID=UPI000F63F7A5|nr:MULTISPECIES: aspartyl-phosphate phosphatase Spo0E family protein [Clostridia]MCB6607614.1 aspartyl-phosphate phosphatase Spo0E family protein [[Clostridium] symbiosum]MCB6929291.1 aspartyl-phosphate phosphatase Spo0E family protein [[Clostridium] symbiosum]